MPKPKKPPTETVRIPADLAKQIRRVAALRDISVPDYIARLLTPLVEKDVTKALEEVMRETRRKPPD